MTKAHTTLSGAFVRAIVPCGFLLGACGLIAQPAPPTFEGHHDARSREPATSSLSYNWSCGQIERAIAFRLTYRQTTDSKGNPDVAAAWGVGSYSRDGQTLDPGSADMAAFVASLGSIAFIAGRCFDTEGEVRISGLVAGSDAVETKVFRVR